MIKNNRLRDGVSLLAICHNLRIAFVQVKLAVHFLLLRKKLAQAFFMLERAVLLLPVVCQPFFLAFTFGFFILGKAWKVADGILNTGYCACRVFGVQVCFVGVFPAKIEPWRFTFATAKTAEDLKPFVVAKVLYFPVVFPC